MNSPAAPPRYDFQNKPWNGVLPSPGTGTTSPEQLQVCKYGSSATFAYSAKDNATGATSNSTITVQDGECWVLAVFGGAGATVSITETSAQAGYAFDHADVTASTGPNSSPTLVTTTTTNPTVTGVIGGSTVGLKGLTVKYYNVALPPAGEIGDFVWSDDNGNGVQDSGEPGIGGVTVTLGGAASATTTTDANGAYLFTGLGAGTYTVSVGTPSGYVPSPTGNGTPTTDNNGSPATVTLPAYNTVDHSVDFGFVPMVGQIGNFVWHDGNGNGIQDAGEPGIAGVTVTLSGAANLTTTTDGSGVYLFTGLGAGTYTVTVTAPANYTSSPANQGGDPLKDSNPDPATVTLATNSDTDLSIDFGFVPNPAGEIGDLVWNDLNGNGIQDAGEPGMGGVTVTLSGSASGTTTTSSLGIYNFSDLPAGSYTVTMTCPAGYMPSPSGAGSDPNKDSNGSPASVSLAAYNTTDYSVDFGCTLIPIPNVGQIGDFVWNDVNGNGVQDAGEPGIGGLTVTLTGPVSATTVTNGFGAYLFTSLPAGSYTVSVGTPSGYTASPSNQGGDPLKDSNGSPASVTLATPSSTDFSIDFGFVPIPPPATGQIGDYVWEDEDGDGVQDASEPGMSGITVTLSGPVNATTTTNGAGKYLFTDLPAGTYTVTVATPAGFTASPTGAGTTSTDNNGSPATVTLPTNSSVDLTIDFGFVPPAGVGRMTGGGAQITAGNVRISRGFTLHCDIILANNLEINWPGSGSGPQSENNFHITRPLRSAQCILDPKYKQPPPAAPFNTFIGVADGTLNGVPGAVVRFTFIDAGEPGRNDKAQIQVYAPNGQLVLNVPLSYLNNGNIQAHYDQPHGSKAPH